MANRKERLAINWKDMAVKIFSDHADWNAAQIHRQLIVVLGRGKAPASVSSVQKELPKWKEQHQAIKDRGIDLPWYLGTVKDYHLSPEGIAKIFDIKTLFGRPPKHQKGAWGISLSIREAIWISRMSLLKFKLITDGQHQQLMEFAKNDDPGEHARRQIAIQLLELLQVVDLAQDDDPVERERRHILIQQMAFAQIYAEAERISELSGIPFDSSDLDEMIYETLKHPEPKAMGGTK